MRRLLAILFLLPLFATAQTVLQPGTSVTIPGTPAVPATAAVTVTCAAAPSTPPYWVYANGMFEWAAVGTLAQPKGSDWSAGATPDYADTSGSPLSGGADIKVTITNKWGIWQPHPAWIGGQGGPGTIATFDTSKYTALALWLKPTLPNQKWNLYAMGAGDAVIAPGVPVNNYGPAPQVGVWAQYKIPLKAFMTNSAGVLEGPMYKFAIQDQTALPANVWYVDSVEFLP